jgi:WD40 repeat protein
MKHFSPISSITVNQCYVATAGYDNRVILWDKLNKSPIAIGFHDHLVNYCSFSPDGNYLITTSSDHSARLWTIPTMKLYKVLNYHNDDVEAAVFNNDGSQIATASRDNTIGVFTREGEFMYSLKGHTADVLSLSFVGKSLISCSDDGTLRKWNLETKSYEILFDSDNQTDTLATNNNTLFVGDDNGVISCINEMNKHHVKGHDAGIKMLHYSKDQEILISMSYDKKCKFWKYDDTRLTQVYELNLPNLVWSRSCYLSENKLYCATFGSCYACFDYVSGTWDFAGIEPTNGINYIEIIDQQVYSIGDLGELRASQIPIYASGTLSNFIIKFAEKIVVGGHDGKLINTSDDQIVFEHVTPLNCACLLNRKLYIGTYTGELLIFNTLHDLPQIIQLHNNAIKGSFGFDKFIISVCANGEISRFDTVWFSKQIVTGHTNIINGCALINQEIFATVSRDKLLKLWSINSLECQTELNTSHSHSIKAVAVDTKGNYIATGSYNGTVAIVNLANNKWFYKRLTNSGISCIKYDQVNNQFIAASYDGNLYYVGADEYK